MQVSEFDMPDRPFGRTAESFATGTFSDKPDYELQTTAPRDNPGRPANPGQPEPGRKPVDPAFSLRAALPLRPATPYAVCPVCPHHCRIAPGATGLCRGRANVDGRSVCANYGRLTSIALDPVEKKPLAMWRPGSYVLSVGSYGCNMDCPFCQNDAISMANEHGVPWRKVAPDELVDMARRLRGEDPRVCGLAFTYNEPLVGWEYVRDCARLAHDAGLSVVLVSNGMACAPVVQGLAGLVDAANIDLKAATEEGYRELGGDLACVRATIEALATDPACHLEVTTLLVPGLVDPIADVDALARWIASLDPGIPYHVTRYFPHRRMADAPTPLAAVRRAAEVARRHLRHVFTGNC